MNLNVKFNTKLLKTLNTANSFNVNLFKIKIFFKILRLLIKNIFYSKKKSKQMSSVESDYDNVWSNQNYYPNLATKKNIYLKYKNTYYISQTWKERRLFYSILSSILGQNKIDSVLEVGCGNGVLINCLSRKYKNINFHGIDLTKNGIREAVNLKDKKNFEKKIGFFFDKDINMESPKNLTFKKKSILNLNEHLKFSLVFTILALEQMKTIQFEAIKKITNISNNLVVLIEPFVFYNNSFISRNYHKEKNYFNLERKNVEINGFKIYREFSLPSKIFRRVGAVILKKTQ